MRLVLLLALFGGATSAQTALIPERYVQLHTGDIREYTYTNDTESPGVPLEYLIARVGGQWMHNGLRYYTLSRQRYDLSRNPIGPVVDSYFTFDNSLGQNYVQDFSGGQILYNPLAPVRNDLIQVSTSVPISLGGRQITFDSTMTGISSYSTGPGGQWYERRATFALGFGSIKYYVYRHQHTGDGSCYTAPFGCSRRYTYNLTYARIDGVEYGFPAVVDEQEPFSEAAFSISAFPNPSASAFIVQMSGGSGSVTVDVHDTLGRRVDGGLVENGSPFTFRATSAGVYFVRARDEDEHTATLRVVRR